MLKLEDRLGKRGLWLTPHCHPLIWLLGVFVDFWLLGCL